MLVGDRVKRKIKMLRMESRFQIAKILAFSSAVNPQPTLPTFCQHKQLEPGCSVVSSLQLLFLLLKCYSFRFQISDICHQPGSDICDKHDFDFSDLIDMVNVSVQQQSSSWVWSQRGNEVSE